MNIFFRIINPVGGEVVSTFAVWSEGETGEEWQQVILLALQNHCWFNNIPVKPYTLVQI